MKSYNKFSLTRDILEHLAEGGKIALGAFFPRGYSYTDPSRRLFGLDRPCRHTFVQEEKPSLSSILSRLCGEGLVARDGAKKTSVWRITTKGKTRLRLQEKSTGRTFVLPESDGVVRLVVFDVPERQRKKRDWLRAELVACDFRSLQRSVWIGTRPLPEEFIKQIDEYALSPYVHIVSVGKQGTLKDATGKREDA